ncbi:conserved Plasmodium protein, unknown function [Plasmodium reichenowi]|uniref:Uncharacterized protein n=1 Tax=Plasmodium reichenowi TaxID=5854 RepID=A0A060S5E5_PLARE|nr:conserved Plasmodium protein, unknown function [Plasmodium reichenowi]
MNDIMCEENKIKCKNIVSIYTIRMYLNGFIIGYIFRDDIYNKYYKHKKSNIFFHYIKQNILDINKNLHLKNLVYIPKAHSFETYISKRLNCNKNCHLVGGTTNTSRLYILKKNLQVSNFVGFRLSFWTCFCTYSCWQLNNILENSILSPIISGFVASIFSKGIFRESKKSLIPCWMGCMLSYIIFT